MKSLLPLAFLFIFISSIAQPIIQSREESVALLRELREIHTPEGIDLLEQVTLNGEKQWIHIRGRNKENPVLLFIHGGPASPIMPISWSFQNPWEDYFTVVQWDQRISGKNWLTADTTNIASRLNFSMIVQDGVSLVEYLRKKLNQEKVFILGYSFGSKVGLHLASRIPEQIHAYIGMGQMSESEPEKYIYNRLITVATEAKHEQALNELQAISPYPKSDVSTPLRQMLVVRKWARYFNGGWYGKPTLDLYFTLPELSPEYTEAEIKSLSTSTSWATRRIMRQASDARLPDSVQVPIIFYDGASRPAHTV